MTNTSQFIDHFIQKHNHHLLKNLEVSIVKITSAGFLAAV